MERKYKIFIGFLILLLSGYLLFMLHRENKRLWLVNNDFLLTNIKPNSIRKCTFKSTGKLYTIRIVCGDEFLKYGDELYIKVHCFIPFKNGKATANIKFENKELKFPPILYLIRDNKVYVKSVKERSKLFEKTKSYKILICDSFNKVIPD
ncbi:MAG: hypothetical protein RL264_199 [Bacteroidota bacterium]|jgi:hypothetical protein